MKNMIDKSHFRLWENSGFKYFKGTWELFGLCSALCQVSPLFNLIRFWRFYAECRRIEKSQACA